MDIYVHSISPIALPLYGDLAIRWYGLAYLAGLLLGLWLMRQMSRRGGNLLNFDQLSDLVTWAALGVMIGGRLGYCFFYSRDLLFDFSMTFPFWGALKVWEGGMSSHGGIIGVIVACLFFARKHEIRFLHVIDLTVLGGSLGFFFGRIANFINGELYGRAVEKPISWAVKFPQEMHEWLRYDQSKLYKLQDAADKFSEATGVPKAVSQIEWKSLVSQYSVDLKAQNAVQGFVSWLQQQAIEKNQAVLQSLSEILTPRYPSQLIQALLEGLMVFIVLNLIWLKPRKPGVISGWFGILYAGARIVGEQFRKPDAHIGFEALGLTRGQWLSVAMLIVGVALLVFSMKRENEKIKGWAKTQDQ